MNIWLWVLLGIVLGFSAVRAFELCKLLLQRLHYIRLEIGLGNEETLETQKRVARRAPGATTSKPPLRGSEARATLKQGDTASETEND